MRTLERNKILVHYALYTGHEDIVDEEGYDTLEKGPVYSDPQELYIHVSPATGKSSTADFGENINYDRILVTDDTSLPIDEKTVFWIDESDTEKPYDYIVAKIPKSRNYLRIAVKKVEVNT